MITLKTLPQATAQEVFDQVAGHLLKQMKQSEEPGIDGASNCLCRKSRKASGRIRCAAGCLMGNDEYILDMEYKSWINLVEEGVVSNAHQDLIMDLQTIHDCFTPDRWHEMLKGFAEAHGLKFEPKLK